MLTSVQDLGRWGYQSSGVPVAGAMDLPALRLGNTMLGNPENAAALEVTLLGPEIEVRGDGAAVFAGADLGFSVNGKAEGSWNVVLLKDGDVITFKGLRGKGCRGNRPPVGLRRCDQPGNRGRFPRRSPSPSLQSSASRSRCEVCLCPAALISRGMHSLYDDAGVDDCKARRARTGVTRMVHALTGTSVKAKGEKRSGSVTRRGI